MARSRGFLRAGTALSLSLSLSLSHTHTHTHKHRYYSVYLLHWSKRRYSVYLLYWYKSTKSDAKWFFATVLSLLSFLVLTTTWKKNMNTDVQGSVVHTRSMRFIFLYQYWRWGVCLLDPGEGARRVNRYLKRIKKIKKDRKSRHQGPKERLGRAVIEPL